MSPANVAQILVLYTHAVKLFGSYIESFCDNLSAPQFLDIFKVLPLKFVHDDWRLYDKMLALSVDNLLNQY